MTAQFKAASAVLISVLKIEGIADDAAIARVSRAVAAVCAAAVRDDRAKARLVDTADTFEERLHDIASRLRHACARE